MIKEMLGERALGIYAVILPLSTFWQIIPTTFSVSLAPFIAKQRLAGEAQYRKTIVLVFPGFLLFRSICGIEYVFRIRDCSSSRYFLVLNIQRQ